MQFSNFFRVFITLFVFGFFGCSNEPPKQKEDSHLGEIHFKVTGSPEAQPFFEEGLLLLHSFEFDDSRTAFLKAQELDPNFVMAYWGEAMSYNHPLWRSQDYFKGKAVLDSIGTLADSLLLEKGTEIERDLWQSLKVLYAEEGGKSTRDKAYSDYMADLYKKHPGNHEIAAFYALSILGAVPIGRDQKAYEKGAEIAKGIIKENPHHPGALHYLIHSYDDPTHAQFALNAANSYSKVAPDAAHALHMPSHIFVAMGMWDDVVTSNIASWGASVNRMHRKNLDNDAQSYHALHWLLYGYLQQGKHKTAQKIMEDMIVFTDTLPSKGARRYLVHMKGNYLVETGDWDSDLANIEVDLEDLNIVSKACYTFINGMKAFKNNNQSELKEIIKAMENDREHEAMFTIDSGNPMCGTSSKSQPNQLDLDQAQIFEMELRALEAQLGNDIAASEKWLKAACELQENVSYSYGPPTVVKPTFELYGDWLLEQNRPKEALVQYEKAWDRGPNRVAVLNGKIKAYQNMGDSENAELAKKALAKIWKEADSDVKNEISKKEHLSEKTI
jgi:tetratricopeptide (TPR) repeat protein